MSKQKVVTENGASDTGKGHDADDRISTDFSTPSLQANVLIRAADWHWLLDKVRLAADSTSEKKKSVSKSAWTLPERFGTFDAYPLA